MLLGSVVLLGVVLVVSVKLVLSMAVSAVPAGRLLQVSIDSGSFVSIYIWSKQSVSAVFCKAVYLRPVKSVSPVSCFGCCCRILELIAAVSCRGWIVSQHRSTKMPPR